MQNQRKTLDIGYATKIHKVSDCQTLKNISATERRETVKRKGLCFNCLSNTHQISNCKSKVTCKIKGCGKKHNTILTMLAINHPLPMLIQQLITKTSSNKNVNKINKIRE